MSKNIYAELEVSLPWHDKVIGIPERKRAEAFGFYCAAVCYCQDNRTDGMIRTAELMRVFPDPRFQRLVDELETAKLLDPVDGGFMVHDYLDWNKSREQIEHEIEHKRSSGRAGGKAKALAHAKAPASENAQQTPSTTPSEILAKVYPTTATTASTTTATTTTDLTPEDVPQEITQHIKLMQVWESVIGSVPSEASKRTIRSWATMGYSEDAVRKALQASVDNGAHAPAGYATAILRSGPDKTGDAEDARLVAKYGDPT